MAKPKQTEPEITPVEVAEAAATHLVSLTKNGEIIAAHPDQVALWSAQGWTVQE